MDAARLTLRIGRGLAYFVYAVCLVDIAILSLAFVLRLLGASPDADFVEWVYRSTERIMEPFRGAFPVTEIDDRSVFDTSLLFAIIVYSVVGAALGAGIDWASNRLARMRWTDEQNRYLAAVAAGAVPAGSPPLGTYHEAPPGAPGAGERPPATTVDGAPWPVAQPAGQPVPQPVPQPAPPGSGPVGG